MGRAEQRRAQKNEHKAKTATYNLTKAQLDAVIKEGVEKEFAKMKKEAKDEAINTAMMLLLTLPTEVLMDFFWPKSYRKKIPEFIEHVLDYYEMWQLGQLDMDEMIKDVETYAGIKIVEVNRNQDNVERRETGVEVNRNANQKLTNG